MDDWTAAASLGAPVDTGMLPQLEEIWRLQREARLPKARSVLSPHGAVTANVQPQGQPQSQPRPASMLPASMRAYRQRATELYDEGSKLMDAEPDMSALQAFAKQQGQVGDAAMLNALAAQYAGEPFQPIQAQYLKRAGAAREPMKLSGGMLTADGQFLKDPTASRDKRAEFLLQQAKAYEQMALTAETAQERAAAQAAQNEINNQLRAMGVQISAMNAQTQRMLAQGPGGVGGTFQPSGNTPDGRSLVTNTRSGINYLVTLGADGTPTYQPYTGASIPKATWEKQVVEAGDLSSSAANSDRLIKQVEANPEAFGLRGAAVGTLPGSLQGYGAKALNLTPEQTALRASVLREAALEVNKLYGAALSMGEQARASSFIPDAKDPPEMVITKLKAARDWAQSRLQQLPPGVQGAAADRNATASGGDDPWGIRKEGR